MIDCVVAPLFHKYVPPLADGVAVRVRDCPEQIVELLTDTVGGGGVVKHAVNVPGISKVTFVKSRIRYVVFGISPEISVGFGAEVLKSQFVGVPPNESPVARTPQAVKNSTPIQLAVPRFTVKLREVLAPELNVYQTSFMIPGSQLGSVYGSSVAAEVDPETKLQVELGVKVVALAHVLFIGAGGAIPVFTRMDEFIEFVRQGYAVK